MALSTYRTVLSTPGTTSLLVLGFFARLPFSCLGILLTLHTVFTLHQSYLAAGLIVTASTLGSAISSPWRGRLVDRRGLRRAIVPSIIVQTVALVGAAFVGYWPLVALALIGGLFALPVFSIVRTSLSVLVPASLRRTAFSLDSVITEFVFMIGPAVITLVALGIGSKAGLLIVAACAAFAGLGIYAMDPPTRSDQVMLPTKLPPPLQAMEEGALGQTDYLSEKRVAEDLTTGAIPIVEPEIRASARHALLTLGGIALLVATATASLILTATDVSVVALLNGLGEPTMISVVMVVWCLGSAIGGLGYGAMTREIPPLWVVLALGVLTIPIAFAATVPMICVATFVAGFAVAPSIASTGEAISRRVPEESRGEAMGWHGSAMTIGGAIGGPSIGAVIDALGAPTAIASTGAIGVVIAGGGIIATGIRRKIVRDRLTRRFGDAA